VCEVVAALESQIGQKATVGVGIPGSLSPATGLVRNANSVWLIGEPFDQDLAEAMGRPIRLENDANCFALSEAVDGAAAGAETVFGVIVGTGVGGGVVTHGNVVSGCNAVGGEWGHNPLPRPSPDEMPGPLCYCGRNGCLETFLSGPGLRADFARAVSVATDDAPDAAEIAELAEMGDADADAALCRYEDRMARALAAMINIVDPHVVVLGGGVSNVERLYRNVPELMAPHVFSDIVATRLVRNKHGDSSGVRGAAWLWGGAQRAGSEGHAA
jgi:fructokinase